MSSRAFSEEFADLRVRCSVVSDCREGYCRTSTQTSDKSFDRWFLIPSCLMCTNPPFLHIIAWFASKVDPQGHFWGRSCRMSPYRRHSASLKDCLSNTKPSSSIGSAVNHMDDDLQSRISMDLERLSFAASFTIADSIFNRSYFEVFIDRIVLRVFTARLSGIISCSKMTDFS